RLQSPGSHYGGMHSDFERRPAEFGRRRWADALDNTGRSRTGVVVRGFSRFGGYSFRFYEQCRRIGAIDSGGAADGIAAGNAARTDFDAAGVCVHIGWYDDIDRYATESDRIRYARGNDRCRLLLHVR